MTATRGRGRLSWLLDRAATVGGVVLLGYVTSWFALPAWAELRVAGYGPLVPPPIYPEINPVARVFLNRILGLIKFASLFPTPPGQARFDFNCALRQASIVLDLLFVTLLSGFAAESVAAERERDTWPGVLATPLTGAAILRGKRLGAIYRSRWLAIPLVALWIVGVVTGAVHPVGLALAVVGLVVSTGFLTAWGVFVSIRTSTRQAAVGWSLLPMLLLIGLGLAPFVAPGVASVGPAATMIPFQTWAGLLGYDDVAALRHGRGVAMFTVVGIDSGAGAWGILAGSIASTCLQAVAAVGFMRAADRGFDAAVGRPVRSRSGQGAAES